MIKALFPCPDFDLPGGGGHSDFAPGTLTIGAPGIVQGDTVPPHDPNNPILTSAMQCNGGFVSVPFVNDGVVNQDGPFTIEAWVRAEWDAAATLAFRAIIDSRDNTGTQVSGFEIGVNQANQWEARLGVTGANPVLVLTASPVTLSVATHIVLTFSGTDAALFINGTQMSQPTSVPLGSTYTPNTTQPLIIGAGLPWLPNCTQPSDDDFFPLLPFNGTIQDVAIYDVVLDATTIMNHAQNGNGNANGDG